MVDIKTQQPSFMRAIKRIPYPLFHNPQKRAVAIAIWCNGGAIERDKVTKTNLSDGQMNISNPQVV